MVSLAVVVLVHIVVAILCCAKPMWKRTRVGTGGDAAPVPPLHDVRSGSPAGGRSATRKADATFFTTYFHLDGDADDELVADTELVPIYATDHVKTS